MGTSRTLVVLLLSVCAIAGDARAQDYLFEREPARLALVVGNPDYKYLAPLHSAKLDAEQMAAKLKALGFIVTWVPQLPSVRDFEDSIMPAFRKNIQPGGVVLFYFSGHGFAYGPHNYIAPADLPLVVTDQAVADNAIAVEGLEDYFARRRPGLILMLIDACRTIGGFVIRDSRNQNLVAKGVAEHVQSNQGINTVEGYAARAGSAALGSNSRSALSPFTNSLAAHIEKKGAEFASMFKDVAADVLLATHQMQDPGIVNWSASDLYLNPTDDIRAQEKEAWLAALSDNSWEDVLRYSYRHAVSRHAAAARQWLEDNPGEAQMAEARRLTSSELVPAWRDSLARAGMSRSLRETEAHPVVSGLRDLVDAAAINKAVAALKAGGHVITWVSISAAPTGDRDEADARAARLTHAKYLLKRAGVDGSRITVVEAASDYSGNGVRVRFFGD